MTTSLTDVDTLRRTAVDMIAEAWDALAAEHVVPCSRYRPYVQVGRDYEGVALSGGPAFTQFSDTLRQLYPAWFDAPPGQFPRWYPDALEFQFIDATIAEPLAAARRATRPTTLSRSRSCIWSTTWTRQDCSSRPAHAASPIS